MTGISGLVLRRSVSSLERSLLCRARSGSVRGVGPSPILHRRPMFSRAVEESRRAAAANQPSRTPANSLAKQLFPSSSPSPGPRKRAENTNKNIAEMMTTRRPHHPNSSGPLRTSPTTVKPLQEHPLNISRPPPRSDHRRAFVSLCSKSNSFSNEPDGFSFMDGAASIPAIPSQVDSLASQVCFDEDDLEDDENLDLELQSVSALPTMPPALPTTGQAVVERANEPPPPSNTSALSWSQSSPSHLHPPPHPPPPQDQSFQRVSTKRASPDEGPPPPKKAKKRELPWAKGSTAAEQHEAGAVAEAATPAPKSTSSAPWNSTASALKAQKKQLKSQLKESAKGEEVTSEEMREVTKSHTTRASAITLSNEQRHVKSLVVDKGQSVFFTGPAGTGKSVLMRAIIQELKRKHARDPERVAVTASTGLAACNIGGMTLHSFAGIGLGKEDVNALIKKIRRNPKAKNRWLKTKTLIIDEISMVDAELFDKLSQIGRVVRNNGRPWGGIQLVITGDFFQLPPVPEGGKQGGSKFAFDAVTWSMSIDHTIGLTEVFRQRDPEFAEMLNEMRLGRISDETVRSFQGLSRPLRFDDGLEVTELFPTRQEVDSSNQRRLQALTGRAYRYDALDTGDPKIRDKLLANMMAPPTIELKKGAQVMLIKNMDETLVNGSLGTVEGFMTEDKFELMGGAEEDAHAESDAKKRVRAFTNALAQTSKGDSREYPLVRFHAVDGSQRVLLCVPEDWKVELPTGEVQASRKQLPLILAWALSIHKAQGQTLERVKVDLGKVFEKGQAYVALSRATTKQGLQVLNFQKTKVMAHPRVVEFYNKLYSAEAALKKKAAGSITSYTVKQAAPASGPRQKAATAFDDDDEEALASYG